MTLIIATYVIGGQSTLSYLNPQVDRCTNGNK